jgi:hypothetical protein
VDAPVLTLSDPLRELAEPVPIWTLPLLPAAPESEEATVTSPEAPLSEATLCTWMLPPSSSTPPARAPPSAAPPVTWTDPPAITPMSSPARATLPPDDERPMPPPDAAEPELSLTEPP